MSDHADLSSIATQLDELAMRIAAIASRHDGTDREDVTVRLYELERSLASAGRRVRSTARLLD